MQFGGVSIPESLFNAAYSGSLVVFAGAGVSMAKPVDLPSFDKLINHIKTYVDPGGFLRNRSCKKGVQDDSAIYTETPEQYLSYLEHKGKNVKKACSSYVDSRGQFTGLHAGILKVLASSGCIRLVTTNFDCCFENAMESLGYTAKVFSSPALPLGEVVGGIVHLHGVLDDLDSMVLTAEDYGKAYVSNGWASRFLVDLFKTYTVLFVGYSCGDSLVDYLTRSISTSITGRSFVLCKDDDADDWRMRGVAPIVFEHFDSLPKIFDDWASCLETSVTGKVRRIHDICRADNVSEDDKEYIIQALRWPDDEDRCLFTSEFCKVASGIEFLELLKENGFLEFLSSKQIDGQSRLLLDWAIAKLSIDDIAALQDLCADYLYDLTPVFFEQLFWNLVTSEAPDYVIASWLPWLDSAGYLSRKQCEYWLIAIAKKAKSDSVALMAIQILLKVSVTVSRSIINGTRTVPSVIASRRRYGEKLVDIVKARSSSIGRQLFDYCFNQIEWAYCIQTKCWTEEEAFDAISYGRSSVGPHNQDEFCDGVEGILIDVARECIGRDNYHIAQDRCFSSNCPLLYRLGLWTKCEFNPSGSDLSFISKNDLLADPYIHREVFLLIKSAFSIASADERKMFVSYIASRAIEGDKSSELSCYNVCFWLRGEMDTCPELASLYKELKQRNPGLAPDEHPDFLYYMSGGFVDNSETCRLSAENFSNAHLVELMRSPVSYESYLTKRDRVVIPTRDYPLQALENLRELLDKECLEEEIELMNLYIQSLKWGNLDISEEQLVLLLEKIVADSRVCVAAIDAIDSLMVDGNDVIRLSCDALVSISLKALLNYDVMFASQSHVLEADQPDWVLAGINHPAGKYVELLAKTDARFLEERNSHWQQLSNCLNDICDRLTEECDSAKCVIACIFLYINVFQGLNPYCFNSKLLLALKPDNWAFSSAWEGFSYNRKMTKEIWTATKDYWPDLFKNSSKVGKKQFEQLVNLYVWALINLVEPEQRSHSLIVGTSGSRDAMRSACAQLDQWMEWLDEEALLNEWDGWLAASLTKLAEVVAEGPSVLVEFYGRWIRKYPVMRGRLAAAILKNCQDVRSSDLFIYEGTFSSIAKDESLGYKEKVSLIIFLLEHQKYLHFKADVCEAIRLLVREHVDDGDLEKLKDAATRKGLFDILFDKDKNSSDENADAYRS